VTVIWSISKHIRHRPSTHQK